MQVICNLTLQKKKKKKKTGSNRCTAFRPPNGTDHTSMSFFFNANVIT